MPPFNYGETTKRTEQTGDNLDEDYWHLVYRKSSYSDINHEALRIASNSPHTTSYVKEFRRHLKNEKDRQTAIERQERLKNRKSFRFLALVWCHTIERIRDDWLCLALLGISMALLSVGVDKGIELCSSARIWLYRDLTTSAFLSYICWIAWPVVLILFAVAFVRILAPQSVGSGIPEVKTMLRGFPIENHLTFNTLIAKLVGLTATLGSGLPLGKEAPFVHISCIVARLINKWTSRLRGNLEVNKTETLVVACAVGISSCFASPIGGVLYSIETTSTYFAVRNYWRAFFGAVCTAVVFRLHAVWSSESETITALFATNFLTEFPFDPQELFIFALIGVICGFLSSLWIWCFRQYSIFIKTNKFVTKIIQANFLLYPSILVVVISFITYPFGFCHIAGHLSTHDQMTQLFSNFTWSQMNLTERQANIVANWMSDGDASFIQTLIGFFIYTFFFSIIASTIAVPSGTFIPVLKLGACLGRLIGESIHLWFPFGVYFADRLSPVIPGGYAVVGAASFAGATTHTISVAVMVLEMTGQITLIAPIMISLLISNAIAVHLCPSIYDTIISLKKLPYLPDLVPSIHGTQNVIAKSFMVKNVNSISSGMSFSTLQNILMENEDLQDLPLVENTNSMILLGSVERKDLIRIIAQKISRDKRLHVAKQRQMDVQDLRSNQEAEVNGLTDDTIKVFDMADNMRSSIALNWQDDGLKNRRSSRITAVDVENLTKIHDDNAKTSTERNGNELKEITEMLNCETVTSNSSCHTILGNVKESMRLLPKSSAIVCTTLDDRVIDLSPTDQKRWESSQLNQPIDFDVLDIRIDLSPFQMVEKTPISQVHRFFTILSLRRAYVTQMGRLVGVVGLNELRNAIDDVNNGKLMDDNQLQENELNDRNENNDDVERAY